MLMVATKDKTIGRNIVYLSETLTLQDIKDGKLKKWLKSQIDNKFMSDDLLNQLYDELVAPEAVAMIAEREFLLELKKNLGSDSWPTDKRWDTKVGFSNWSGIKVKAFRIGKTNVYVKRVIEIDLNRHYLFGNEEAGRKGTIPNSLGMLTHLRKLNLCYNFIVGSIPPSIVKLAELTEVRLEFNHLSGNLPQGMSALGNLKKLSIDHNKIGGNINELAKLSAITDLNIHENLFSGQVPESMADNNALTHFWFYGNNLSMGPKVTKREKASADWKYQE